MGAECVCDSIAVTCIFVAWSLVSTPSHASLAASYVLGCHARVVSKHTSVVEASYAQHLMCCMFGLLGLGAVTGLLSCVCGGGLGVNRRYGVLKKMPLLLMLRSVCMCVRVCV